MPRQRREEVTGKKGGGREEETQRMRRYLLARVDVTGLPRLKIRAVVWWTRAAEPVSNENDEEHDVGKLALASG